MEEALFVNSGISSKLRDMTNGSSGSSGSNRSDSRGASSFASNDLAKTVATTASVLVNSTGTQGQAALFANSTFQKAIGDTLGEEFRTRRLLRKHAGEVRISMLSRRRAEASILRRKKHSRKDFSVLSEQMLHSIPTDDKAGGGSLGSVYSKRFQAGTDNSAINGESNETSDDPIWADASTELDNDATEGTGETEKKREDSRFSLFQGFSATLPEVDERLKQLIDGSAKLLDFNKDHENTISENLTLKCRNSLLPSGITEKKIKESQDSSQLLDFQNEINYRLDLMEIRKSLSSNEINEIDQKIDRLYKQRKLVFDHIASFERDQTYLEDKLLEIEQRLTLIRDIEPLSNSHKLVDQMGELEVEDKDEDEEDEADDDEDYVQIGHKIRNTGKRIPSRKHKATLQRYYKPGNEIHSFKAHDDSIICFEFDEPFGTLVTASQDNTVRVWDMSRYRCMGLLEGHFSNVTCMEMQNSLVLTGSLDATLKLWDTDKVGNSETDENDHRELPLLQTFESHVEEVTALSMYGDTIVSGSADKTIRQWDINTGRCMQTIDVLWATNMMMNSSVMEEGTSGMLPNVGSWDNVKHPFIGALQCYDAALASGGSDGIVRLWDLRSGEVVRQLIGHTGPVSCLQFDDKSLVTGSVDRSVRIWDLRTGGIVDSFAYDSPITSLEFDYNKIVCTNEENTVKVYDRIDEKHRKCGSGVKEKTASIVNYARYRQGYLIEGRDDGTVGVWAV
ncbi:hypothetical protein FOA43_000869 [Brettanomyces nanus]|uniref:Mitochondrial division protein 1 n=1 Tax=Eeniella nana TaxID=13502 RepID=A0A875RTJ4_EENNA|nr:uncharacterized protein FOA43_000869 [Brettanomyces nanus]QPG73557.1 hypothetical protein FOA43_000869 [Brettanomyces nanus]